MFLIRRTTVRHKSAPQVQGKQLSMESMLRLRGPTKSMAPWLKASQVPAIGELCLALHRNPDAGQGALYGERAAAAWPHKQHGTSIQGLLQAHATENPNWLDASTAHLSVTTQIPATGVPCPAAQSTQRR